MGKNKEFKKESIQEKLDALEKNIQLQDQKEIQELLKKIDSSHILFDSYVAELNKQVSFHISFG